jgi:hypothetical protein
MEDQGKTKQNKGLDTEQTYGHGSQRGLVPGLSVPAGCRQQASASASASASEFRLLELNVRLYFVNSLLNLYTFF